MMHCAGSTERDDLVKSLSVQREKSTHMKCCAAETDRGENVFEEHEGLVAPTITVDEGKEC